MNYLRTWQLFNDITTFTNLIHAYMVSQWDKQNLLITIWYIYMTLLVLQLQFCNFLLFLKYQFNTICFLYFALSLG
jgi:hypothetical protein